MNILYLIDHYEAVGGTENHLARLITAFDQNRFSCTVVAFHLVDNHLTDMIRDRGMDFLHVPVGRYYTFNALKKGIFLSRLIKEKKIDIVQTFHFKSDVYGTIVARLSGIRKIISSKRDIGDLKSSWHFFLNKLVRRIPCRYIVPADAVGRVVAEKEGVDPGKLITIYNGVDIDMFKVPSVAERQAARQALGISENDFVVGMVAWLRPEKNYIDFFEALSKASRTIDNIKAVVVGGEEDGGIYTDYIKEYVNKLGFDDNVIYTGQVRDVKPFIRAFDIGCLVPEGNEGFSNSILEKMAMGLPMVVTDVGGNAEAVIDGDNGFVIAPNDPDRLAEVIVELATQPEQRKIMGERSVRRVREMFTLEAMVRGHEDLYESVLKQNG